MKNIFKLILIFFFVCKVSNAEQSRVIDGDTIIYNGQKIRLFGIDAPEKKQKCKKPFLSLSFISFSKEYDCGLLATKKLKQKIDKKIIIKRYITINIKKEFNTMLPIFIIKN